MEIDNSDYLELKITDKDGKVLHEFASEKIVTGSK